MKNRHENIKNELAYFYKVIKNMDKKENIKQSKINEHEMPLDEILYDQFSVGENLDKLLEERNLLGWIELIENPKLYEAVKNLSIEDQIFIGYIVKEGQTQREVARIYGINQRTAGWKLEKTLNLLSFFVDKIENKKS